MTHASLFSGIGGFDLAAQWAGFDNVFQVEKDEFCQKVLSKNFPNTEKYKDIYDFNGEIYNGKIDVISGGFPCQPFSIAGKRKGSQDDRYLWDEMFRVITEILPTWVIAENVGGLLTIEEGLVLEKCFTDLESANYQTQAFIIPAVSKNAPHRRDRVWIVANRNSKRNTRSKLQFRIISKTGQRGKSNEENSKYNWGRHWYEVATEFCRVDDGIPNRVDRVKSLGNAIVPQVAYEIFMGIREISLTNYRHFKW